DRSAWTSPGLLRAAEYALVIAVGADAGAPTAAYAVVAVLAFRYYDVIYRVRVLRMPPSSWALYVAGGWQLRMVVVWAGVVADETPSVLWAMAAWVVAVAVVDSAVGWTRARSAPAGLLE